jgi:hypothetical protein
MDDVMVPGVTHRPPSGWELFIEGKMEADSKSKLAPPAEARLKELNLDTLNGPGAWASYDKEPRDPSTRRK